MTPIEKAKVTLSQKFKNTDDFEWEEEESGDFVAIYLGDGDEFIEVIFDEGGHWLQSTFEMDFADLPKEIKLVLRKEYNTAPEQANMVLHLDTRFGDRYIIEFDTNEEVVSVAYDKYGRLVEKSVVPHLKE